MQGKVSTGLCEVLGSGRVGAARHRGRLGPDAQKPRGAPQAEDEGGCGGGGGEQPHPEGRSGQQASDLRGDRPGPAVDESPQGQDRSHDQQGQRHPGRPRQCGLPVEKRRGEEVDEDELREDVEGQARGVAGSYFE